MPVTALLEDVPGDVIFVQPMGHYHDASFGGVTQSGHDYGIEAIVYRLHQIEVIAVTDLQRIVIDDEIGASSGDAAVGGDGEYPSPVHGLEV